MGYYSFYRIIKDILYNLKKNKILVIVAIIILILFFCNNVFASDNQFEIVNPLNNDIATFKLPEWVFSEDYNYFINYKTQTEVDIGYTTVTIVLFKDDYNFKLNKNADGSISGSGYYKLLYSFYDVFSSQKQRLLSVKNETEPTRKFENFSISSNFVGDYFSNTNIYNSSGSVSFPDNSIKYPQITTSLEDLQTLNFDTISVSAWNWSNKDLYILFYDRSLMNNQNTEGLYPKKEIKLTTDTSYYIPEISSEQNAIYWIANDNTGLNFKVGGRYEIRLAERVPQSTGRWLSWRRFV